VSEFDHWLTQQELAARWRGSVRTVNRRIKSGDLTAVRIGALVRIDPESVARYERANLIQPDDGSPPTGTEHETTSGGSMSAEAPGQTDQPIDVAPTTGGRG
jgi:excisionase family DNA binding protein